MVEGEGLQLVRHTSTLIFPRPDLNKGGLYLQSSTKESELQISTSFLFWKRFGHTENILASVCGLFVCLFALPLQFLL